MTRLTMPEARLLLDEHLSGFIEFDGPHIEATVIDKDITETRDIIDGFIASLGHEVDPASIEVTPDRIDDMDVPCVSVIIRLEE